MFSVIIGVLSYQELAKCYWKGVGICGANVMTRNGTIE